MTELPQRFWDKVNKNGPVPEYAPWLGNCWLWVAGSTERGSGRYWHEGKLWVASRVAYRELVDPEIEGLMIDHLCYEPACVRPSHLRLATNRQNGENRKGANGNSSTGVRGVSPSGNRHRAYGWLDGKQVGLGSFAAPEEAGLASSKWRAENIPDSLVDIYRNKQGDLK